MLWKKRCTGETAVNCNMITFCVDIIVTDQTDSAPVIPCDSIVRKIKGYRHFGYGCFIDFSTYI